MTQLQQEPSPSWTAPIAFGAVFAFLVVGMPVVWSGVGNPYSAASHCCCGFLFALPCGFLPAFLALRGDPYTTPGQGFAVAFIAVGLAQVVLAVVLTASATPEGLEELQSGLREHLDADGQLSREEIDLSVAAIAELWPYLPALSAVVVSLLAGVAGLVSVALFRARRRDRYAPDPGYRGGEPRG